MSTNNVDTLARRAERIEQGSEQDHAADQSRLAALMRSLSGAPSRRDVLRELAAAGLGLGLAAILPLAEAKPTRRKKRRRPKPVKPNQYGCFDVDAPCRSRTQCCSGICAGQPGKKQCRAHNTGGCTSQFNGCGGLVVGCGTQGYCFRTTGKASFCGGPGGACVDCKRDADCQGTYGAGAACVVCADCIGNGSNGTVCYPAGA